MAANRAEFRIRDMARVLEVAESGFYRWDHRRHTPSSKDLEDARLIQRMRTIHAESRRSYGEVRLRHALRRAGEAIGLTRLRRLKRAGGIHCETRKAYRATTRRDRRQDPSPDLVQRDFRATGPNELWVADATHVHTDEGALYLAIILDVFSRRIVGHATDARQTAGLMVSALRQAVSLRAPSKRLVHHSDQGSQYTSMDFRRHCKGYGIRQSMGSVGDCYDNAMAEAVFSTIETELLDRCRFATRAQASRTLIQYIDGFYNSRRMHSSLGYLSPVEYEQRHRQAA